MSRVSYFQRFSQRENHATNNTLLLLRHLYQSSPFKVGRVLTSLVETELSIGLSFEQQVKGDQSVPDALISQQPLDIYIETKRGESLDENQILRHVASIAGRSSGHGQAILLGLTKEPIAPAQLATLRQSAAAQGVQFGAVTFSQVVEAVRAQCADYEHDLLEIVEDYEEFLAEEGLLQARSQRLAVFPCGQSFAENEKYGLYYEPPARVCKRDNRFIGIYRNKTVALVGLVEVIAICAYRDGEIEVHVESGEFTEEHRQRVKEVMEATPYYDLKADPLRFYLVPTFAHTDLKKTTPGGIMGLRYLDLVEVARGTFDPRKAYGAEELACLLNGKTFT